MGIIVIAIIASLTFIIMALVYKGKAETRRRRKILTDKTAQVASEQGLTWNHTDIGLHRSIAWFAAQRILLFIDFAGDRERVQLVHMNDIAEGKMVETASAGAGKHPAADSHITRVSLELQYKERSKDPVSLQFYNEVQDGIFEKALLTQKARNWKEMIFK